MTIKKIFSRHLNENQVTGSGLALVLFTLILHLIYRDFSFILFNHEITLVHMALLLVIWIMVYPQPFRYFGYLWFALGEGLGYVVSRILLSIVFLVFVIPVGLLVRPGLRKNMQLNVFKKSKSTVFKKRDYQFSSKDFDKPF